MIKRTTVRLPAELLRKAKRKADAEGRTLTALMEDGLRYVVSDKPAGKKQRTDHAAGQQGDWRHDAGNHDLGEIIEELDDLEYIERLNRGFK